MKKFFKISGYILVAVVFSVALSGCTKKSTSTNPNATKVIVWSFEDEDVWKPIQKEFESENKGLEFVYQKEAFDSGYENRVLNSVLSGAGPDVWAMPNDWVYRHKDKLSPMPEKLAVKTDLDNGFVPVIKQSVLFDGKIYALSPSAEPLMIYYNSKLFDAALDEFNDLHKGSDNSDARKRASALLGDVPTNWTDFVEAVKLIDKKDGNTITRSGVALGTDKISNAADVLYLLMLQNETKIASDNLNLATFNLPKETPRDTNDVPGLRAIEFYTSFATPSHQNYSWNDTLGNDIEAFAAGKVAMIVGYSSLQNVLAQKYPDFRYKKASMPQLTAESDKFVDYAKFTAFGVSSLSLNPEASWSLVSILTNSSDYTSALRLYTSKKASSYDITVEARLTSNPEKIELATAQTFNKGRYPLEFDQNILNAIYAVNNGIQDNKSALDLAASNITELLRQVGW